MKNYIKLSLENMLDLVQGNCCYQLIFKFYWMHLLGKRMQLFNDITNDKLQG